MWTTIVQVTLPPAARPVLVQVTVPEVGVESSQSVAVAETKLVPAGRTSSRVKPRLFEGPRMSEVRGEVRALRAKGLAAAVLVTLRSAFRVTAVGVVGGFFAARRVVGGVGLSLGRFGAAPG